MIKKIRKMIRALPKSWEVKAIIFKELNVGDEMGFSDFIGNLKTHDMEMKIQKEREPQKKMNVTFKATPSILEEEKFMNEDEEDEFVMLVRKVGKMFYKKGRMSNSKEQELKPRMNKRKRR